MHLKKRMVSMVFLCAALAAMSMMPASAVAASSRSLTVGSEMGSVTDVLTIPITVNNPESIAGAAFTLQYSSKLNVTVETNFFDKINYNAESGSLMVAAASASGASASAPLTIMTLKVSLNPGYSAGTYPITIKPTRLYKPEAGYDTEQSIDLLTGYETGAGFSVLLDDSDYADYVVGGEARFLDGTEDSDSDGYTDLQELQNGTDPYEPTEPDRYPGYNPCTDSRVAKQQVELSAPADVIVGNDFEVGVDYSADTPAESLGIYVYFNSEMVEYTGEVGTVTDGATANESKIELSFSSADLEGTQPLRLVNLPFTAKETTGAIEFSLERFDPTSSDVIFCPTNATVDIRPDCVTPVINSFTASPASISEGESVTLSWDVTGDENTTIGITAGGIFGVPTSGLLSDTTTVNPTYTTTYTLTAKGCGQSVSKSVTVNVTSTCDRPVINSFYATPTTVAAGGQVTLSWNVSGASSVQITEGVFGGSTYPARGTTTVSPAATTTYTLTAQNSCGTVRRSVRITVTGGDCDPPVINTFTANPTSIATGGSTTLTWDVSGATKLGLSDGVFGIPISGSSGTKTVSPAVTTTYTLRAENNCDIVTKEVTVTVGADAPAPGDGTECKVAPGIDFSTNKESIVYGGEAVLSWQTSNAGSVRIETDSGQVVADNLNPAGGKLPVSPEETTKYFLIAKNSCGTSKLAVKVTVNCPEPGISFFNANGQKSVTINYGDRLTLAWKVVGAEEVHIEGYGSVDPQTGNVHLYPEETTTYKLIATSGCGATAVNAVKVNVNCLVPGIVHFTANKDGELGLNESVTLSWEVVGAEKVVIEGIGEVDNPEKGSKVVVPGETTTYKLVAYSGCGETAARAVTVNVCSRPVIEAFTADPEVIRGGSQETTLSWEIKGATKADIKGIGEVDPESGSKTVKVVESGSFWLRASNDCGVTETNVNVTFHENLPPDAPQLVSPGDGAQDVSMTPTLKAGGFFDADGDPHVKTRWQIAEKQPIFDEDYLVYDEVSGKYLTQIIVPTDMVLEANTLYYWRVMYFDGNFWSSASEPYLFTTTAAGPEYENGVRSENRIGDGEEVLLGGDFVDENGDPVNTDTIKVFKSEMKNNVQIGIKAQNGATIRKCGAIDPNQCAGIDAVPDPPEFPYGLVELALDVDEKGGEAEVSVHFSEPIPDGAVWYKYDPNKGEFYDYELSTPEDVVVFSQDRMSVTLKLKDGGYGDLIEDPDGRIIDPGGLSTQHPADGGDDDAGGGGGGGCFIETLLGDG